METCKHKWTVSYVAFKSLSGWNGVSWRALCPTFCNLIGLKLCMSLPSSYAINLSLSQQLFIHIGGWSLWRYHIINAVHQQVMICICHIHYKENNEHFTHLLIDCGKSMLSLISRSVKWQLYNIPTLKYLLECKNSPTVSLFSLLSITSTSCQSCRQTTTWITVRRRWTRWMQPCQTWRLLWREGKPPTLWYHCLTLRVFYQLSCVCIVLAVVVWLWSQPFVSLPCGEVCCHLW